jgi:hypothetical protein
VTRTGNIERAKQGLNSNHPPNTSVFLTPLPSSYVSLPTLNQGLWSDLSQPFGLSDTTPSVLVEG